MSPVRIALPHNREPESWRDIVKEYQENLEGWKQEAPGAPEFYQRAMSRALKEYREKHYQTVFKGVLGEFEQSIGEYHAAGQRYAEEKGKEVARWNDDKFLSALHVARERVSLALSLKNSGFSLNPGKPGELETMYNELASHPDIHVRRAAAEVFRAALTGFSASAAPQELRMQANHLTRQADRDLKAIRVTPEVQEAFRAREAAGDALLAKKEELKQVAELMDGSPVNEGMAANEYAFQARRVRIRRDGQVTVYDRRDPEVTGVYIAPEKTAVAGGNEDE